MGGDLVFKGARPDLRLAVFYFNQVPNTRVGMDDVIDWSIDVLGWSGLQSQSTSGTKQLSSHLDVFDSTADQAAGLDWVPGHVKDLRERNVHSEERRDDSGSATNRLGGG